MRTWRVQDVMTADVVTVNEDTPYREIVDVLQEHRISAAPVVDQDRRVVGVVSEADLLCKIEYLGQPQERRIFASRRRRKAEAKAHGERAKNLMSAPAITVVPGTSLTAAAKLMDEARVKRLPVVDPLGKLVGIVARSDLLRVYLRPDREIERDVIDHVLTRTLWVEPGRVTVEVNDGVVVLTGRTDRYSTARLAVELSRAVPGVVEVVDRLGFDFDDRRLSESGRYVSPLGVP
ncbi:MAG TPA: CBS domain-containing protein [Natronosporangium sp.]